MTKTMKVEGPLHVVCQCDKCKEALAQPVQEPVVQEIKTLKRCLFQMQEAAKDLVEQAKNLPQQRPWVGLTDEEIADCAEKMEASDPTDSFWREFFRGIEAKLKEKNNG